MKLKRTMRLGYAMELVVVVGFGMAMARADFAHSAWVWKSTASARLTIWVFVEAIGPFLAGVALAGGVGLAVEFLRKKSPAIWGWGRWTWSLQFFVTLMLFVRGLERVLAGLLAKSGFSPAWDVVYGEYLRSWTHTFSDAILSALVPFLITAGLARLPSDPSPDGREWAGRAFALASILWFVIDRAVTIYVRS